MEMNSDNFLFDQEIIVQFNESGVRIAEVPVPALYESSSASFVPSSVYGLPILGLLFRYVVHRAGLWWRRFQSLLERYRRVTAGEPTLSSARLL